jgi:hypothetical protein
MVPFQKGAEHPFTLGIGHLLQGIALERAHPQGIDLRTRVPAPASGWSSMVRRRWRCRPDR